MKKIEEYLIVPCVMLSFLAMNPDKSIWKRFTIQQIIHGSAPSAEDLLPLRSLCNIIWNTCTLIRFIFAIIMAVTESLDFNPFWQSIWRHINIVILARGRKRRRLRIEKQSVLNARNYLWQCATLELTSNQHIEKRKIFTVLIALWNLTEDGPWRFT